MPATKPLPPVVYAVFTCALFAIATLPLFIQTGDSLQVDLSGRWQLNPELSEDEHAKLEAMQASRGVNHRPPAGLHGLGKVFGGGGRDETPQARDLFLRRSPSFFLKQRGERIEMTDSDGRVRVLTANGRTQKIDGHEVRTRWERSLLVSETSLADARITETYDRLVTAPQLIVTTELEMHGRKVSVRRVYEESP